MRNPSDIIRKNYSHFIDDFKDESRKKAQNKEDALAILEQGALKDTDYEGQQDGAVDAMENYDWVVSQADVSALHKLVEAQEIEEERVYKQIIFLNARTAKIPDINFHAQESEDQVVIGQGRHRIEAMYRLGISKTKFTCSREYEEKILSALEQKPA